MANFSIKSEIIKSEQLGEDIFRITLLAPDIAREARPGQFIMVKTAEGYDPLLARPFSVHQATANGWVQILIKVVGKGTKLLSLVPVGRTLDVTGPFGEGFSLVKEAKVSLVGGGIGAAPLFYLAKEIMRSGNPQQLLGLIGARNEQELKAVTSGLDELGIATRLATDDGSAGHHGMVTELMLQNMDEQSEWLVYCCGPHPMLRSVAKICREHGWRCQVSMETMMACGMGACLGCAVPRAGLEGGYAHVCKDGPVFDMDDVAWL